MNAVFVGAAQNVERRDGDRVNAASGRVQVVDALHVVQVPDLKMEKKASPFERTRSSADTVGTTAFDVIHGGNSRPPNHGTHKRPARLLCQTTKVLTPLWDVAQQGRFSGTTVTSTLTAYLARMQP